MRVAGLPPSGGEALDVRGCDPAVVRAALKDIAVSNTLLGGRAAVTFGVRRLLDRTQPRRPITLLDLGAGAGDIADYLARRAAGGSHAIVPVALDWHREAARLCRKRGIVATVGDVDALPVGPAGVDIVVASQLLHHFSRDAVIALLRELDRVARLGVVIADLERRRAAALGIWLASFALAFHPVSRHDGVLSVQRGFTRAELATLLEAAGVTATVHHRPGFRLVAEWATCHAHH